MLWIAFAHDPKRVAPPDTDTAAATDGPAHADTPSAGSEQSQRAATWWALQFTPRVCWLDAGLLLEVSTCQRLFGGRQALVRQLATEAPVWGLHAMTVAPTGWGARAVLHRCATANGAPPRDAALMPTEVWPSSLAPTLDALPLSVLTTARPVLGLLQRLGCRTLGQLRRLPRPGLARRFGPDLLRDLDRAYGTLPEHYPWETLPERFAERIEWHGRIEHAAGLAFAAHRLLRTLQAWLQARQAGVTAFCLKWEYDRRRSHPQALGTFECRLSQPSRNAQHLSRLLTEHLGRVTLDAPVTALQLEATDVRPLAGLNTSLLPDEAPPDSERLPQLLERLAARLGPQQVLQGRPEDDHRPNHIQSWRGWRPGHVTGRASLPKGANGAAPPTTSSVAGWLPPWLLEMPLALGDQPVYQGELSLLLGPHRVASGWWDTTGHPPARDYFVADSPGAGLVWVWRERASNGVQWFLHGIYG